MPVTITGPPDHVAPPSRLGERVNVDAELRVDNGPLETTIVFEVQPQHPGYSVTAGATRTETLPSGNHTRRYWFVLQGTGQLNVVNCRILASVAGEPTKRRGFAVFIDNG